MQDGGPAPEIKIELVLNDDIVEKVIDSVLTTAYTGLVGDGKIFIYKVDDAVRIRSKERGMTAI